VLVIDASCAQVAHARSRPARQREDKRVDPGIVILREECAATDRDDLSVHRRLDLPPRVTGGEAGGKAEPAVRARRVPGGLEVAGACVR